MASFKPVAGQQTITWFGYTRTSHRQPQSASLSLQRFTLQHYIRTAAPPQYREGPIHLYNEGYTISVHGTKFVWRPQLATMIATILGVPYPILVIECIDRLGRRSYPGDPLCPINIYNVLVASGHCRIISVVDGIDTATAEGRKKYETYAIALHWSSVIHGARITHRKQMKQLMRVIRHYQDEDLDEDMKEEEEEEEEEDEGF